MTLPSSRPYYEGMIGKWLGTFCSSDIEFLGVKKIKNREHHMSCVVKVKEREDAVFNLKACFIIYSKTAKLTYHGTPNPDTL